MVSLAPREQGLTLSFWEVKHCKDRVRSRDGDSKVVRQMTDYRSFLQENSLGLGGAYRATSENLIELARLADIEENLSPLIAHAARQDPFVDPVPNLLVFGTEHELASPEWRRHRAKLDLHEADFRVTETSSENHDLLSAP